ncbi:MAG: hypothetical protein GWP06_15315, partial [Actinobacteria bacterium]|nr:hypothetical protein [Actinomycetota bacterium]
MKRIKLLLVFIFLFASLTLAQNDIWISHGPYGGSVQALALDPANVNVLFAGLKEGGVWKSEDGGRNWVKKSQGLFDEHIQFVQVDPKN